jgi:adenylate cyclase
VLLSLAASLGLLCLWLVVIGVAFLQSVWLAVVTPLLAIVLTAVAAEAWRGLEEQRRRRRIERQRANLARYFAPVVVDRLAASDKPSGLEGTQEAAVLFVDMIGFTRISEGMTPEAAMNLLRAFHARVEQAIFAHGGMVDKFMGDGALACFGVPDPSPTAAHDALAAAEALIEAIGTWNETRLAAGEGAIGIGIGIHHGPVLMGDIGGGHQFQFTIVGDTVNVASRLESLTRQVEAVMVVSGELRSRALAEGGATLIDRLEALPSQALRGRAGEVTLWRLPKAGACAG